MGLLLTLLTSAHLIVLAPHQSIRTEGGTPSSAPQDRTVEGRFPPAPSFSVGPLAPQLAKEVQLVFGSGLTLEVWGEDKLAALEGIQESGDVRLAWLVSDLMRMTRDWNGRKALVEAGEKLLNVELPARKTWRVLTDHLVAWDVPAPPEYFAMKANLYTRAETFMTGEPSKWKQLFQPGRIDWRLVSWGGVGIDDRAPSKTEETCQCIPAADDPRVTDIAGASWLKDSDVVFGIVVEGEARAYPRQIMEVREMVNDTLGGRRLGIPYCTLCASAQAFFTDNMPAGIRTPVLRTSGLLMRSNKVMFDLNTYSLFDTFLGKAVTGPLAKANIALQPLSVVTTSWGAWRAAYPKTTVLEERYALGKNHDFRNGRDADGPIFPIGEVDDRLPVQADVLGVINASGDPIAFSIAKAIGLLKEGRSVKKDGVHLYMDAGGVRARGSKGEDLVSHQAFWFAWSQFYPDTALWK